MGPQGRGSLDTPEAGRNVTLLALDTQGSQGGRDTQRASGFVSVTEATWPEYLCLNKALLVTARTGRSGRSDRAQTLHAKGQTFESPLSMFVCCCFTP